MSYKTNFERVINFCIIFGQPAPGVLQKNIFVENPKLVQFRLSLIDEEFKELQKAVKENDMVETIDALADILYVVYGMGVTLGIDLDQAFRTVHGSNMSKLCKTEQEAKDTIEHYKTNFEAVRNFCRVFGQPTPGTLQKNIFVENPKLVQFRLSLIDEEFKELQKAVKENDMTETIDALADILYVVYGMGVTLGIDLDEAFRIVHGSNMSKLCETEQEAKDTIEHYKTLQGFENVKVVYRPSSDGRYYVVYNEETGKILKSKYFTMPDFTGMLK